MLQGQQWKVMSQYSHQQVHIVRKINFGLLWPTNSINNITCVRVNWRTSLVNGDLVLLKRKYRALPHLELGEQLFDMCLVDSHDKMARGLCGVSYLPQSAMSLPRN